jgi:pantothenate kinase
VRNLSNRKGNQTTFNADDIFNLLETTKSTGNDALLVYYTDYSAKLTFLFPDKMALYAKK